MVACYLLAFLFWAFVSCFSPKSFFCYSFVVVFSPNASLMDAFFIPLPCLFVVCCLSVCIKIHSLACCFCWRWSNRLFANDRFVSYLFVFLQFCIIWFGLELIHLSPNHENSQINEYDVVNKKLTKCGDQLKFFDGICHICHFQNLCQYSTLSSKIEPIGKTINFGKPYLEEYWSFCQIVNRIKCSSKLAIILPNFNLRT